MRIGYFLAGVIAIIVFLSVYYYMPYTPIANPSAIPDWNTRIITSLQALSQKLPEFLWFLRGFDIIIQAILVVAMAAGMAIFFGKEAGGE
ncbi:MAG: hypothetical protein ACTSX9_08090 [Candidatus Njordarchaeales archaeon]